MRVSVIGSGYVGLVSAVGLAQVGHQVVSMDINQQRVEQLRAGHSPIFEHGLEDMFVNNQRDGRLSFSSAWKRRLNTAES